ncbi:hypothetical protein [Methylobacterium sp. Leaf469]|uniref:hypothetical protein n=1 Tax=Methylobacterium sp. Leaf469 TaxID=1736387 RepID=UPI000AF7C64D|nr:hypothetical protein [Methylobacterium sp. Leaf469]
MTSRMVRRTRMAGFGARVPVCLVLLLAGLAVPADEARADSNECRRVPALSEGPAPTLGRITAAGRTAFLKDGLAQDGCPEAGAACRERAYLVAGDGVILTDRRGSHVCATYPGARDGADRTGWLPAAAVADEPAGALTPEGWSGTWTKAEAEIRLAAGVKPGTVAVKGDATWGMGDPERMRRGGVHTGEIEGEVTPAGDAARFAMGEGGSVPVETADAYTCKVWLRRLGPWLVVDDNLACGGANVTFRGVYRRRP